MRDEWEELKIRATQEEAFFHILKEPEHSPCRGLVKLQPRHRWEMQQVDMGVVCGTYKGPHTI